jgi:epsilon-lactone hydrolase
MRPHVHKPIDPVWVRENMGRPRAARALLARCTGAIIRRQERTGRWPGGEVIAARRTADTAPVVLYLHGGGFIACSPETHRMLSASLAQRLGAVLYVPSYRLAPEHPFPAALDDALAAYEFLLEDAGVAPHRLVLAGDSAGGGLAMSLALALRDRGLPQPSGIVTFSPWVDLAVTGASLDENTDRCAMFAGDTIRNAARFYVGASDPRNPMISPLYGDFTGVAPMLVHASMDEVLRDDAVRVAERARSAGVPVTLRLWPRVPHVWQFFGMMLPEARESLREVTLFVQRCASGQRELHDEMRLSSHG